MREGFAKRVVAIVILLFLVFTTFVGTPRRVAAQSLSLSRLSSSQAGSIGRSGLRKKKASLPKAALR